MTYSTPKSSLSERDWQTLADRINNKKVTPIIGAGACADVLPDAKTLARQLAEECAYPLGDPTDLARVSQYMAIMGGDALAPKERVAQVLRERASQARSADDGPHALLAEAKLPLYITTNYDHLMSHALRARGVDAQLDAPLRASESCLAPGKDETLVYHLHGHWDDLQSMVLTENDYLEFMVRLTNVASQVKDVSSVASAFLPARILKALTNSCLLFVGYSMSDWTFRLLLRGLVAGVRSSARYPVIAVQLPPDGLTVEQQVQIEGYLENYFAQLGGLQFKIYWGDIHRFSAELRQRLFPAPLPSRAQRATEQVVQL